MKASKIAAGPEGDLVQELVRLIKKNLPAIKQLDISDRKAAVKLYGGLFGHASDLIRRDPRFDSMKGWNDARIATRVKRAIKLSIPEVIPHFNRHRIDKQAWAGAARPMQVDKTKKAVIARLLKEGRPDLVRVLMETCRVEAEMKRPGPFLELAGKPGTWQVVVFQPHTGPKTGPGSRPIGELAWGRIQKVTKAGKTTGREFAAYFFAPPKISVSWNGRTNLATTYKVVDGPVKASVQAAATSYQVAFSGKTLTFRSEQELVKGLAKIGVKKTGVHKNPRSRPELQGQPKFDGVLGPMYNGPGVVRYESKEAYRLNSM